MYVRPLRIRKSIIGAGRRAIWARSPPGRPAVYSRRQHVRQGVAFLLAEWECERIAGAGPAAPRSWSTGSWKSNHDGLGVACFTAVTSRSAPAPIRMACGRPAFLASLGGHCPPNGPRQVGLFPTKTIATSDSLARFCASELLAVIRYVSTRTPGSHLVADAFEAASPCKAVIPAYQSIITSVCPAARSRRSDFTAAWFSGSRCRRS